MDPGISSAPKKTDRGLSLESNSQARRSRAWSATLLAIGVATLVLGPSAGALFILLSLTGRGGGDTVSVTTIGFSMVALGAGVGGALAWIAYGAWQGRAGPPFHPAIRWFWTCLVGWGLALALGQVIISLDLLAPVIFPPFHVLAIALPGIAILFLVGYALRGTVGPISQRGIIGALGLGAFGATAISFSLEAAVVMLGLVILVLAIALAPGGLAQLAQLEALLSDPSRLQDPQLLVTWLLKPGILIPVILVLVVIAPLIEEGAKSVGVPLLALWRREQPGPAQGWLWGLAAGTGFAIVEGLFNAAASLPFWGLIALLRLGATLMHVVTAGITGLGWVGTLKSRRPWPVLGGYLAAVVCHALWNGLTVLMALASAWMMEELTDFALMTTMGLLVLVGLIGLFLLALIIAAGAAYITLRLRGAG